MASWLAASIEKNSSSPDQAESAVKLYEATVRLAPNDYRWRVELGRAYEQVDKPELAESEFKKAVELAPTYAFGHWHLGNFYLRQGREAEAFAELKTAAAHSQTYREQVLSLAWDYFDKDPAKVEQLAGDSPEAFAGLAIFFAARGQAADSLRIWNQLSDEQKAAHPDIAKSIAHGLFIQRFLPSGIGVCPPIGYRSGRPAGDCDKRRF